MFLAFPMLGAYYGKNAKWKREIQNLMKGTFCWILLP